MREIKEWKEGMRIERRKWRERREGRGGGKGKSAAGLRNHTSIYEQELLVCECVANMTFGRVRNFWREALWEVAEEGVIRSGEGERCRVLQRGSAAECY